MSPVEKVARAMCDDLGVNPDDWSEEDGVRTYAWQKEVSTARAAIAALDVEAGIRAALGYMRNARIDLESGAPKATAIRTISGGIKQIEAFLAPLSDTGA